VHLGGAGRGGVKPSGEGHNHGQGRPWTEIPLFTMTRQKGSGRGGKRAYFSRTLFVQHARKKTAREVYVKRGKTSQRGKKGRGDRGKNRRGKIFSSPKVGNTGRGPGRSYGVVKGKAVGNLAIPASLRIEIGHQKGER